MIERDLARTTLTTHERMANSPEVRHRNEWEAMRTAKRQERKLAEAKRRLEELQRTAKAS